MLATTSTLPIGPEWAYEFKWDGMRAMLDASPTGVTISTRAGNDATKAYPEIEAAFAGDGAPDILLDGEIVAFDEAGRPSFGLLQRRMHVRAAAQAKALASAVPATFLIFDVLRLYGVELLDRSYEQRRATLERVAGDHPSWVVSPSFDDGEAIAAAARANGLEGIVAKRRSSRYRPGARSSDWVKVKFTRRQEFVVLGWEAGEGARADSIGSVLLGVADLSDPAGWAYVGQAGSGLGAQSLRDLASLLGPLVRAAPPLSAAPAMAGKRPVTWVAPQVVVEVEYSGISTEGRLRHPVFLGIRTDKAAREVVWELAEDAARHGSVEGG